MARSLYEVFLSRFLRSNGESEERDGDSDRFAPSPLDLSVRSAHGGSDEAVDRALTDINEQAETIERQRRDR